MLLEVPGTQDAEGLTGILEVDIIARFRTYRRGELVQPLLGTERGLLRTEGPIYINIGPETLDEI